MSFTESDTKELLGKDGHELTMMACNYSEKKSRNVACCFTFGFSAGFDIILASSTVVRSRFGTTARGH